MNTGSSEDFTARAVRIWDLVLKDARQAISCRAAFVSANYESQLASTDGRHFVFSDAGAFNSALFSILTNLSLVLARLFDPGPNEKFHKSDIASIPILMRYLALDEVAEELRARARSWTPNLPGLEDLHESSVEQAIQEAIAIWDSFRSSPAGADALLLLRKFRNHVLAHTLDINQSDILPTVNDALILNDAVVALSPHLSLVFHGAEWDAESYQRRESDQGHAFWRRTIRASLAAMDQTSN